jgi:hypothetical protein
MYASGAITSFRKQLLSKRNELRAMGLNFSTAIPSCLPYYSFYYPLHYAYLCGCSGEAAIQFGSFRV